MDIQKLKQILKREESEKLDFKAELHIDTEGDKKELVKDVTAIANSRGGRGYIIYGVEDKTKKILGINTEYFQEEQIQQIIHSRTDPPVPVALDLIDIEGKTVAVLTIFRSRHAPHQVLHNGSFYIRRGSTSDYIRRSELASILQENGLMTFETVVVRNASMDDIDCSLVDEFFKNMEVSAEGPRLILMQAFGFISEKNTDEYSPTIGGLLLFGKNPIAFLPQCYVRIDYKESFEIISGNIFYMMDEVTARVKSLIRQEDYPIEAFEEALSNALAHRDYLDISRGVSVTITDKAIEITNPGSYTEGRKVFKSMEDCRPKRRNPWLYHRLITIDKKKRFLRTGIGMKRIRKSLEKIGPVKFINLGKQNCFKVVLPLQQNIK
jgi:ATP-dependent DNA helicase RecG